MIDREKLLLAAARRMLMLYLTLLRCSVRLTQRHQFRGPRPQPNTRWSAMEAHADIVIHNNRVVIDVMHHGDVDIVHRAVVVKVTGVPVAALVASAHVAETVVHAAIKADVRSPIAAEESIVVVYIP